MTGPSRRTLLRGAAGGAAAVATLGLTGAPVRERWDEAPLRSDTVALTAAASRRAIAPGHAGDVLPGTRIARDARDLDRLVADERAVRDAVDRTAAVADLDAPARDLLLGAALDLHVLSTGLSAPVASWAPNWRYVWPRDSSHAAVAWSRLGFTERAAGIVRELARVCADGEDAGWFAARTVPGTARPPDGRERQLDGTGWFLWALDDVAAVLPTLWKEPEVASAARRCVDLLRRLTADGTRLPPASPDFWEVPESLPTIATAALAAVGLERGGAADAARTLHAVIAREFGSSGYSRHPRRTGADAGIAFLLPPYARTVDDRVAAHLDAAQRAMARPAGGLAPGALWRRDGISWTPQTALLAQARAASGDAAGARALLNWLASHRTASGSLPEKVTAAGRPASVAPLAWTAAVVATALVGS